MEPNVALTETWKYQLEGQGHGSKRCTKTGTWKYQLEGQGHGSINWRDKGMILPQIVSIYIICCTLE